MSSSESKWVQVSSSEVKWVQVSSGEFKWVQVSPSGPEWVQVSSSESKWVQVRSSEFRWVQVGSSTASTKPRQHILSSHHAPILSHRGSLVFLCPYCSLTTKTNTDVWLCKSTLFYNEQLSNDPQQFHALHTHATRRYTLVSSSNNIMGRCEIGFGIQWLWLGTFIWWSNL